MPANLDSTWLVRDGDNPAFARPDLDDSQWAPFDPNSPIGLIFKDRHPEVVWYRLHVRVDPAQTGLALRELSISRAFEIYVNGERLMASGRISPFAPYTLNARILKRIPDQMVASGSLVIALRVHISAVEWETGQDAGYYATNLRLGQQETLYRDDWLEIIGQSALDWTDHLFMIGLGLVALVLFYSQRRQTEYLWIFALGVMRLLQWTVPFITTFHDIPLMWGLPVDLLRIATPFLWTSMYFAFLHQRIGWRWRAYLLFAGVSNVLSGIAGTFFTSPLPFQLAFNLPFVVLLAVVIPIVLAVHWRRGNREAGILLIPGVLFSLYVYAEFTLGFMFQFSGWRVVALRGLELVDRYPAGPFAISLNYISGILSTLSLAIIMLLRSTRMSRRQAILEGELAAAQEVQQILLPEQMATVPGFKTESVYQPAQQVGGDFFQILSTDDGGLLVVVGDVAGKGLPAAMLVSVIVGAIRGIAGYTQDPAELLANLNERLIGRSRGSFSTALAACIAADGSITIANAGHLSPYLDGRELELPGALPLGIVPGARYQNKQFSMPPGSRLTFYSDGVIEAQNPAGELFGFERGQGISTQPAAAIVEAALRFGQEDDITVVTIERHGAIASVA